MKKKVMILSLPKGFTLIELLVVIAIVGVLIAVGTSSYLTASKQSRDTRRKTDLEQIRQALETYRSETGAYPGATSSLTPDYITTLPRDPQTDGIYHYVPGGSNITYELCTTLEIVPSPPVVGCSNAAYNYEITNP
jgi:prepilin-type N-terminal cleavage/methylation domain-containing protein